MSECQEFYLELCKICGDRAFGYNFDVWSCESCKAFFRRNGLKPKYKCRLDGDCRVNKDNRTRCKACRLEKCVKVGMKKVFHLWISQEVSHFKFQEWILSEEQRRVRKPGGRKRRNSKTSVSIQNDQTREDWDGPHKRIYNSFVPLLTATDGVSDTSSHTIYSINQMYDTINEMLDSKAETDIDDQTVKSSDSSPVTDLSLFESEIQDSRDEPILANEDSNDLALVPVSRPITDYRNNLSEMEEKYLSELLAITNNLKTPIGTITSEAFTFTDVIQVLKNAKKIEIEGLIAIPKSLVAYKKIKDFDDRFQITKPALMEIYHIRGVTNYFDDGGTQYLIVPTASDRLSTCLIRMDVIKETHPKLYYSLKTFYDILVAEWDSDYVIIDLLSAIALFNPDRANDTHTIRYLLLKYRTEEKAIEKYSKLLKSIDLVKPLADTYMTNLIVEDGGCARPNGHQGFLDLVKSIANI